MNRERHPVILCLAGLLAGSCVTSPLPVPPTVDPERISLSDTNGPAVEVEGGPGAVDPGDEDSNRIRVTRIGEPIDGELPQFDEVDVAEDGSFSALVGGLSTDRFFIELITSDEDIFLVAVTGGFDGPVVPADPGPDRDDDGSPDAIDCAPDDPGLSGRRCP
jgi:hypothetical protein